MENPSVPLKLLGDATRWRIVEFLARPIQSCCSREDGVCGCDLEAFLGLTQATVSHHMKQLVEAGLVTAERRGRWVYYELVADAFRALADELLAVAEAAEAANSVGRRGV
ncbi:MAG TPA: metalloregulator ArsR/SmtB family transcription factor [Trueperaceae bacterium]|nr:metalloregulator ArsR/SmtB family transcription factor [Trueperaceae bacterium]